MAAGTLLMAPAGPALKTQPEKPPTPEKISLRPASAWIIG
jgi:hypothetical protein